MYNGKRQSAVSRVSIQLGVDSNGAVYMKFTRSHYSSKHQRQYVISNTCTCTKSCYMYMYMYIHVHA